MPSAAAGRRQSRDHAFEMGWQRVRPSAVRRGICPRITAGDANRAAPSVEQIEDVRFAELNPDRSPPRPFRVIALAVLIDPLLCHGQRHALRGPAAHLLEHRPDDPYQVPLVLLTEIAL